MDKEEDTCSFLFISNFLPIHFLFLLVSAYLLLFTKPAVLSFSHSEYSVQIFQHLYVCVCVCVCAKSLQIRSVAQLCPTLCDPMNHSTPGLPVHHQLPEFTETHVHQVSDAIQPSHPLSSPSPPAPNPSQHQGLFQ